MHQRRRASAEKGLRHEDHGCPPDALRLGRYPGNAVRHSHGDIQRREPARAQDIEVDKRGLVDAFEGPGLGAAIDFGLIERKKTAVLT